MGLFSKFVNKLSNKLVDRGADAAANKIFNAATKKVSESSNAVSNQNYNSNTAQSHTTSNKKTFGLKDKQSLLNAITARFVAEYEIKQNVSPESINAACAGKGYRPYDLGFFKNGKFVAAVLYTEHNRDHNQAFQGAKTSCEQMSAKFFNFYAHMPNDINYVINRIESNL